MRAIVSAQAGLVAVIGERSSRVATIDHPEFTECDSGSLPLLFADASDVIEIDVADDAGALNILTERWRDDRCLRLMIILIDKGEASDIRRSAAAALGHYLQDPRVRRFVTFCLYSRPFSPEVDAVGANSFSSGDEILEQLLKGLERDQVNIELIHSAWVRATGSLPSRLKALLEGDLVSKGAFYELARTVRPDGRIPPHVSQRLIGLFGSLAARDSQAIGSWFSETAYRAAIDSWFSEIDLMQRAHIAVQALTDKQAIRIKRYAQHAIAALGSEARGRNYVVFIRDVAINVIRGQNTAPDTKSFYDALLAALPKTLASWHLDVWQTFIRLTDLELTRIRRYARARVSLLGQKASGQSADDLVHEAIAATFSGKRPWTGAVDLCSHLLGAIRSISSSWGAREDDLLLETEISNEDHPGPLQQFPAKGTPAETYDEKERFEQTRKLFLGDRTALRIIDLLVAGYTRDEIKDELGLSQQNFASTIKRIRRRVAAAAA